MHSYKVYDTHEFGFDYNGNHYLVIYGSHINGGFIAVPNWNVSVECCNVNGWEDIYYNADALYAGCKREGFTEKVSLEVAKAVKDNYDKYLEKVSKDSNGIWLHYGCAGIYIEGGEIRAHYIEASLPKVYYYNDNYGGKEIIKYKTESEMKELAEKMLTENKGLSL